MPKMDSLKALEEAIAEISEQIDKMKDTYIGAAEERARYIYQGELMGLVEAFIIAVDTLGKYRGKGEI